MTKPTKDDQAPTLAQQGLTDKEARAIKAMHPYGLCARTLISTFRLTRDSLRALENGGLIVAGSQKGTYDLTDSGRAAAGAGS